MLPKTARPDALDATEEARRSAVAAAAKSEDPARGRGAGKPELPYAKESGMLVVLTRFLCVEVLALIGSLQLHETAFRPLEQTGRKSVLTLHSTTARLRVCSHWWVDDNTSAQTDRHSSTRQSGRR